MVNMVKPEIKWTKLFFLGFLVVITLVGCSSDPAATPTIAAPEWTATPSEPTPTPIPAAAVVNGERIPLTWYESEVARYLLAKEAQGTPVTDQDAARETVLNDLIDQVLLAQGAQEAGASVTDADVQTRLDALAVEVDLPAWMAAWGYTEADLFQALRLQVLAANQRDRIAGSIPESMEQVELQQILSYSAEGAHNALVSLNSGTDFNDLAFSSTYDVVTGGLLGWVPRGYLLSQTLEDAAFGLPVGSYSEVIETDVGYHIIRVLDRGEHPLSTDARLTLQRQAVQDWVADRRTSSIIEIINE